MKNTLLTSLRRILLGGCVAAVVSFAADSSDADAAWAEVQALKSIDSPAAERVGDSRVVTPEFVRAYEAWNHTVTDTLLGFIDRYPSDPRRWQAVISLARLGRMEVGAITEDVRARGWDAVTWNTEAQSKWDARIDQLLEELIHSPTVPENVRRDGFNWWTSVRTSYEPHVQLAEFRRRLDVLHARYPDHSWLRIRELQYLNRLRGLDAARVIPWLSELANRLGGEIGTWAKSQLVIEDLRHTPLELKFTAIDGREVDTAKLRGKVVLLDFWATWCGPCKAELPNLKSVYERWHAHGFEVIAVSLDKPGDRQKLADFVAEHGLPWPQHHELNSAGKNVLAEKYGILGIPSMFLFDRDGRLATLDARGKQLEPEVKRLLGL